MSTRTVIVLSERAQSWLSTPSSPSNRAPRFCTLYYAKARFAERDLAIESGYAAARLAALAHDRILLGVPLGHGVGGRLDGTDQMHAGVSSPGSGMRLDPKSR